MKKKQNVNLCVVAAFLFAASVSCYLSDATWKMNYLSWQSVLSENVIALSAEDEGVAGRIFTCYNKISSERVYGDIYNEKYCAICDDVPVTRVWEETQCRK